MIDSPTLEIRYGSALALANTGRKSAIPLIIKKLQSDGEELVRYYSATALGTMADPSSEPALIKAFKEDATASVKNASAIALGNIKGKSGITALISIAQDTAKANDHRWNSATALGTAKSTEAVPMLQKMLSENNGTIHYQTAEALRKITGQKQGYEI
jgi:HEAT repeat protein